MLIVSNYHYIRENFASPYPSIFGMTPDNFRKQLLLLKNQGNFIQPDHLVENAKDILESRDNFFLITFDDGLKEQYRLALPILDELDIPALFFINSINHLEKKVSMVHQIHLVRSIISSEELIENLVIVANRKLNQFEIKQAHQFYRFDDSKSAEVKYFLNVLLDFTTQEKFINTIFNKHFNKDEVLESLYMNVNEIKELIQKGYVGSHTHTHLPLGIYDEKTILYELETTKKYLENLGGKTIDCVAYPYGTKEAATDEVGKLAKQASYKLGFTTQSAVNDSCSNLLLLNRFDCNDLIGGKNYK